MEFTETQPHTYTFTVTITHADTGWDHYADGFFVLDAVNAQQFGHRVLAHPHVNEQPFTRSLSYVHIPEGTCEIVVSAKDNLGNHSQEDFVISLCAD